MTAVFDYFMGSWAVFLREMLLLRRKLKKLGFTFYSLLSPLIFLAAFGFGFRSRVSFDGMPYEHFLVQGIVCMTSMINSYNITMTSVSFGRLYDKTFQNTIISPVSSASIMTGLVLSGLLRGVIASVTVIVTGWLLFGVFPFTVLSIVPLFFNLLFFSSVGVVIGLYIKDMEASAMITNFFIMPMNFFSGTFYPIDNLPAILKKIVYIFPLTHTNIIMRASVVNSEIIVSLCVLVGISLLSFVYGTYCLSRYSE